MSRVVDLLGLLMVSKNRFSDLFRYSHTPEDLPRQQGIFREVAGRVRFLGTGNFITAEKTLNWDDA